MNVPVDGEALRVIEELAEPPTPRSLTERRARFTRWTSLMGEPLDVSSVESYWVSTADGHAIPIRLYRPESDRDAPLLVYLHGGGWIFGNIETVDPTSRRLAVTTGCPVAVVDYRLAPENPFPTPLDDCYQAIDWLTQNARALGVDNTQLVVCGDSAGGHLALGVGCRARDENGPRISGQVLVYPTVDDDVDSPSCRENGDGLLLTRDAIGAMWQAFAPGSTRANRYVTPLRNGTLTGLPSTLVITAGFDPLRSEGERLVRHLRAAGTPVVHKDFPHQVHGFWWMAGRVPAAIEAFADIATWLQHNVRGQA